VTINRSRVGGGHVHKARPIRDLETQAAQILRECGAACCERDLRQEPEGVQERPVMRGAAKRSLCGVGSKSRYNVDVGAEAELLDNLPPPPRAGQDTEPNVPHARPPSARRLTQAPGPCKATLSGAAR
jgi:hypothetical protein